MSTIARKQQTPGTVPLKSCAFCLRQYVLKHPQGSQRRTRTPDSKLRINNETDKINEKRTME